MAIDPVDLPEGHSAVTYPDTPTGALMRQRDELARSAEGDRATAAAYVARAEAAEERVASLESAIAALEGVA